MTQWRVQRSVLKGQIEVPPSKSHSIRAVLYAALATGESYIHHLLESPDVEAMIRACRALGAQIEGEVVRGVGGRPQTPADVIDAGNSGLVLRFIGALGCLADGYVVLTGDTSIRGRRPAQPLIDGLSQLGAFAISTRGNGLAPLVVHGPVRAGECTIQGQDSQPVSALLTLAALLEGKTTIRVQQPGELPWIDLTLSWLERLGVPVEQQNYQTYKIQGGKCWSGFTYRPPGDFSSAAFPIAAAIVTDSPLEIANLDFNDPQGDKALIEVLRQQGAPLEIGEGAVTVTGRGDFRGNVVDMDPFIDAVPILAVLGCFAEGETQLVNAAIARQKESDRIRAICTELGKMGADIEERPDGLVVRRSTLCGTRVHSHHDHRLAMALAVAGMGATGETIIDDVECVAKTYPSFDRDLRKVGALIQPCKV